MTTSTSVRRRTTTAAPAAVTGLACAFLLFLAGCSGEQVEGPDAQAELDAIRAAVPVAVEQALSTASITDAGITLSSGTAVPAAEATGAVETVTESAQDWLSQRQEGQEPSTFLLALRTSCFARTLTGTEASPDIAQAVAQATVGVDGDLGGLPAELATELDSIAASGDWVDELTAESVCLATAGQPDPGASGTPTDTGSATQSS